MDIAGVDTDLGGVAELDQGWRDDREFFAEPVDGLAAVLELDTMMAVFAAERLVRIARLRREFLDDAPRVGCVTPEMTERSLRLELACALRITEYAAEGLLSLADAVVVRYPAVLESLDSAQITEAHARILVDGLDLLEPHQRDDLLPGALEEARSRPVGDFRRRMRVLVESARAVTLEQRHEDALVDRRVVLEPAADGMAWLMTYLPAVEGRAIFDRVTAMAEHIQAEPDETRTRDQVRADVVGDLLIDGVVAGHPKKARGVRASVVVTVPVLALLDAPGADAPVVEGVGPIPVSVAKRLCGGSKQWMRVLTHPETGMVLSVGREKYKPPASLAALTRWRADRCLGPGCGTPAARCQIDHQLAWAHGGSTSLENNAPLCQGHHTVKHHGGWIVAQLAGSGGVIEWTSPMGRRYLVEPERRVPVFTPVGPSTPPADPPF